MFLVNFIAAWNQLPALILCLPDRGALPAWSFEEQAMTLLAVFNVSMKAANV